MIDTAGRKIPSGRCFKHPNLTACNCSWLEKYLVVSSDLIAFDNVQFDRVLVNWGIVDYPRARLIRLEDADYDHLD